MPTFGAFITSVTAEKFVPKVTDNVLNGNVLCNRLLSKAKNWSGGSQLVVPLNLTADTRGGSYSGLDLLDTSQANIRVRSTVDTKQNSWPVVLSNIQRAANSGPEAVIDLIAAEMEQSSMYMADAIGDQCYGLGSGNDITGLRAIVDDATDVTTFQGVSRSTYTNWNSNRTAQSGALSLANIAASFDLAQHGTDTPTLGCTTPAVFTIIEALFSSNSRYLPDVKRVKVNGETVSPEDGFTGHGGFTGLMFRGVPIVADEKCTAQRLYLLNEKHLWFAKMKHPDYKTGKEGFAWSGWMTPTDQDGVVGRFYLYGNLVSDSCRSHAVRTGVSS